jgi:hypothetical protein
VIRSLSESQRLSARDAAKPLRDAGEPLRDAGEPPLESG